MPQKIFLAPAAARSWLAQEGREISAVYDSGTTVERTNNRIEGGEVVFFDETIPKIVGGIAEIEVLSIFKRVFAAYLIVSSAAKLTAINTALQAYKLYYGEVTQGITPNAATKSALAADVLTWRDEATTAGKDTLAAHLDDFHGRVLLMGDLADFRREMRWALGITQTDIDRVVIGAD